MFVFVRLGMKNVAATAVANTIASALFDNMSSTDEVHVCYKCKTSKLQNEDKKWLGCDTCSNWAHPQCEFMTGLRVNQKMSYICGECIDHYKQLLHEKKDLGDIHDKLNTMAISLAAVRQEVEGMRGAADAVVSADAQLASTSHDDDEDQSWAQVMSRNKRGRVKKEKKNLLVLRAEQDSVKATDMKEDVSKALEGVQIQDSKFSNNGNIVMNFQNELTRDEAAEKLKSLPVKTTNVRKLKPKIVICNVNEHEIEDDLIKNLVDRNDYLKNIDNVHDKFLLIRKQPAARGTSHYIYKCEPDVRCMLKKNKDKVKLKWGVHTIWDRYYPLVCYHCQRFGHMAEKCKEKDKDPWCFKCAGRHRSDSCVATNPKKCISCVRHKIPETDHSSTDRFCPVRMEEITKITNITDHGY